MSRNPTAGGNPSPSLPSSAEPSPPDIQETYPLSFAQQRLWILEQVEGHCIAYNLSFAWRLKGSLKTGVLREALERLVERHEALRTNIVMVSGEGRQAVRPLQPFPLPVVDLRGLPESSWKAEWERRAFEESERAFDLSKDLLIRATLLEFSERDHVLILVLHHGSFDGWSLEILCRELTEVYEALSTGRRPSLSPLETSYVRFALAEREALAARLPKLKAYWKTRLEEASPLDLPTDRPRPTRLSYRGGRHAFHLPEELVRRLQSLSNSARVTMQMTLLAAYQLLLGRYCNTEDVIVGVPSAGRTRPEWEALIGCFVNPLALRADLSGNPTFSQFLQQVRQTSLGAYDNQDFPFDLLVEEIKPERQINRNPLIPVLFQFWSRQRPTLTLDGLEVVGLPDPSRHTQVDLTMHLVAGRQIEGTIEYFTDLFAAPTIHRFAAHYRTLLERLVEQPGAPMGRLAIVSDGEAAAIVNGWNKADRPLPTNRCVHEEFEHQAALHPDAVAIISDGQPVSYRELNERADRLARHLGGLGIETGARVALLLDRSVEMIVGMLASLKAGAAYVPLDPAYPAERLDFILNDVRAQAVLTLTAHKVLVPPVAANVICLDKQLPEGISNSDHPSRPPDAAALAYVIFTSGSTGLPKGVAVSHRAITRLVLNTNYLELGPEDRVAHLSNVCFDAATFEIWGALLNGAAVVIIPKAVALEPQRFFAEVENNAVTTMFVTTALFNELAAANPRFFQSMKQVLFGGEAVDPEPVRRVLETGPPRRLLHVYGPTECTTFATFHIVTDVEKDAPTIPIGRPISHTTAYVLDRHGNLQPAGVPGELYLGGPGVADGYLNRPELTAEHFVPDRFSNSLRARLYRTGDIVKCRPDGSIEFVGRADGQVKIRGFRVEPSEVEIFARRQLPVEEAAVIVREDTPGERCLVAYVVPRSGAEGTDWRGRFREKLPAYLVPSDTVELDALPMTPSGKIDRRKLPKPEGKAHRLLVLPRTPLEERIAAAWREVLGVPEVGIHDSFFDLGGHSLKALRLLESLRACGVELKVSDLFETPTVEGLAAKASLPAPKVHSPAHGFIVRLRGEGSKTPLFIIPGGWGGDNEVLVFASMLPHLNASRPVYAVRSRAMDETWRLPRRAAVQATAVLNAIREVQPEGPYMFLGECCAAIMAMEIARQAERQGAPSGKLILLDAQAPPRPSLWTAARRLTLSGGRSQNPYLNPEGLPPRIAKYYRLLDRSRPAAFQSELHLLYSSGFSDPESLIASWKWIAKGPITLTALIGDHNSYIREHAAQTAAVLNRVLDSPPSPPPPLSHQQPAFSRFIFS